jgi:uncharacterized protein (TIGR03437 family)
MKVSRFLLITNLVVSAFAANLDNGGNGFLRGDYFVREVIASDVSPVINIGQMRSIYGTMNFDGNGNYQFRGSQVSSTGSNANQPQPYTINGRYTVGSNGLAEIESLAGPTRHTIFAAVGETAVVGSMTEAEPQLHDVFIAIPAGTAVTNATLTGRYLGGTLDAIGGQTRALRTSLVSFNANGGGGLSNATATGQARNIGVDTLTQSIDGATYSLTSAGSGTMTFPIPGGAAAADQRLIGGEKIVYTSADGELVIGGAANGYDIFVAFKAPATGSNSLYNGTYVLTSLLIEPGEDGVIWSSYGSSRASGVGSDISHERTNEIGFPSYDITYSITLDIPANGISERERTRFAISNQGRHLVWTGKRDRFSFLFATKARNFTGSGVFLHPLGVTNAASFSPVTASVAPGEFVTLFGSGLADSTVTASSLPFPSTLGGVQVLVNGQPISLYSISPTQISGILPYSLVTGDYAAFSVNNNGRVSNTVTQYTNNSATGVFTNPANGTGTPAALHADFSVVTNSSPARRGETIAVFVTGLGAVSPAVATGAAAPSNPLSRITAEFINVQIDGNDANVSYAGLAPNLAGLYQINFTVPNSAPSGPAELWIDVPGSITSQTFIPIQ